MGTAVHVLFNWMPFQSRLSSSTWGTLSLTPAGGNLEDQSPWKNSILLSSLANKLLSLSTLLPPKQKRSGNQPAASDTCNATRMAPTPRAGIGMGQGLQYLELALLSPDATRAAVPVRIPCRAEALVDARFHAVPGCECCTGTAEVPSGADSLERVGIPEDIQVPKVPMVGGQVPLVPETWELVRDSEETRIATVQMTPDLEPGR